MLNHLIFILLHIDFPRENINVHGVSFIAHKPKAGKVCGDGGWVQGM